MGQSLKVLPKLKLCEGCPLNSITLVNGSVPLDCVNCLRKEVARLEAEMEGTDVEISGLNGRIAKAAGKLGGLSRALKESQVKVSRYEKVMCVVLPRLLTKDVEMIQKILEVS